MLRAGGAAAVEMVRAGFELADRLLSFPLPVVIACAGHAIAMGAFLLLSGDYRVGAAGPFKLTANEVAIGITMPYAAVEILRQRLTPAAFNRAVTLAEPFAPANAVGPASSTGSSPAPSWTRWRATVAEACPPWTSTRTRRASCGPAQPHRWPHCGPRSTTTPSRARRLAVPQAKQRTPALRDHVLRVAVATLAADGVAGFTARRVAEGAGDLGAGGLRAVRRQGRAGPGDVLRGLPAAGPLLRAVAETDDPRADLIRAVEPSALSYGTTRCWPRSCSAGRSPTSIPARRAARLGVGAASTSSVRSAAASTPGVLAGDETDIAHVLVALAQGLCTQETGGWLGTTRASRDRRWALALRATLDGLAP